MRFAVGLRTKAVSGTDKASRSNKKITIANRHIAMTKNTDGEALALWLTLLVVA